MKFQQVFKGGQFGPGMSFPKNCYFENCTFKAPCKFQEGCIFKGCKFVRCCPPYYTNPWSEVKKGVLENCTLDYVTVDSQSLLKNCKPMQANVAGRMNPPGRGLGNTAATSHSARCEECGLIVIPSKKQFHPGSCDMPEKIEDKYSG